MRAITTAKVIPVKVAMAETEAVPEPEAVAVVHPILRDVVLQVRMEATEQTLLTPVPVVAEVVVLREVKKLAGEAMAEPGEHQQEERLPEDPVVVQTDVDTALHKTEVMETPARVETSAQPVLQGRQAATQEDSGFRAEQAEREPTAPVEKAVAEGAVAPGKVAPSA